jgi:glutamine cyclotransferase
MKKRNLVLILLLLFVGAAIFGMFGGCNSNTNEIATFNFKQNLQAKYGEDIPVVFTIPEGLKKVELVYNDSVFQTWNNPKEGEIKLALQTNYYGVGTRPISLRSTDADGLVLEDNYFIRVVADKAPLLKKATIVKSYPHSTASYTQGLEFYNGKLFEGTGDPGQQGKTVVGEISLQTGDFVGLKKGLDASKFGEGITILKDKLYQLTWQNQQCFVYDLATLDIVKEFQYVGQGWGLTNDGKWLIMSNGSEYITFRDPNTFNAVRTIQVYDDHGPRVALNELEYIDGMIYANVYQTSAILVIDPHSGRVMQEIDASELVLMGQGSGDVLNGIAYNSTTKQLFMTGKYWSKLFEVKLENK